MTGDSLDDDTLMSHFEAARWASSSQNDQPWKFRYARRNTTYWDVFLTYWLKETKSERKTLRF